MDAEAFFPSKWLKAEDIGDKEPILTINTAAGEEFGDGEKKLVLFFDEVEKGLVLNRTNYEKINEAWGSETDNWKGRKVQLYTALVSYKKKEVKAIRLRIPE
jgi:hypothetical protein